MAGAGNELIALEDPTLFVVPHVQDFVPAVWRKMPDVHQPSIRWTEPPPFLPPAVATLGQTFNTFMASNQFARLPLHFKPAPQLSAPRLQFESMLPQQSTLQIKGEVSGRTLINPISVPTLPWNDVIESSRVQVLVNPQGNVVSDVLLQSSGYDKADQIALKLARRAQFSPTNELTFGEMIFHWHTIPTNTP